jgi:hypothetical protein
MKGKYKLEEMLLDIQNELISISNHRDEIWMYHPKNPSFVNPISLYDKLTVKIKNLERQIDDLEFMINSLN